MNSGDVWRQQGIKFQVHGYDPIGEREGCCDV